MRPTYLEPSGLLGRRLPRRALGNGKFYAAGEDGSAVPVAVEGVGGVGTLTAVTGLTSGDGDGECALLTSTQVDCWGYGPEGELGNGQFYTTGDEGSATPVAVEGVGGTGNLTGAGCLRATPVTAVTATVPSSVRVTLTAGDLATGELGNGEALYSSGNDGSAVPVEVVNDTGTAILTDVANLPGNAYGYCATLTLRAADCWGDGSSGQLGNGEFYTSGDPGSAVPVAVETP